ncbi:propionate catabolism operon regulatory protein PrpR [Pelomicrobium methylotrophicum]|uniref:Propionate catabolism operon regulatory protein PrpR n=1 Tax=Pelomicrobium methylotrophicum TaxID=2602750 RepID=A0A5C7ESS5_9PROT|nr:propionate catabolism operon regulatory protein PrpR [Pelomicrobium methylotrophicum]TXF09881.1 propionate catabolism operon regulatory protein PrpR [Pelomicrobium methylotrophicum]
MAVYKTGANRKPQIWAISYKSLSRLIRAIISSYAAVADIRIIDNKLFDEAVAAARELVEAGEVDAFLSAGANGAFLRDAVDAPVALIKVSGFDILRALLRARQISERVALVTYQEISAELEEIKQLLKLDVAQRSYKTIEDAIVAFKDLAAHGYTVIVGSSLIVDLAERSGLTGIFLYSETAVRQALDDAVEMARVARIEEARRERLNAILRHLQEGVVAVDMEQRIEAINPAMESLLGVSADWSIGKRLSEIAPQLALEPVLRSGAQELGRVLKLGGRTIVVNRIPIREHGSQTGAVVTCQDSATIHRADRSLRVQARARAATARYQLAQILGSSPAITEAKAIALQYTKVDSTVLITGESGTGKELFAQGIHNSSRRRNGPFIAVNCAALPESLLESELFGYEEGTFTGGRRGGKPGLFESAHGGTLFLDEVGEMPLALQTRLLRVLQEREVVRLGGIDPIPVDVRVIAATHRHLRDSVAAGRFREDLYYRLNILHLYLPPLRERLEDLPELAARFLDVALRRCGAHRSSAEILESLLPRLQAYSWPGNIRELENVLERVAVLYGGLGVSVEPSEPLLRRIVPELFTDALAPLQAPGRSLKALRKSAELAEIRRTIQECGGDQTAAAMRLGISKTTLWRKLRHPA